MNLVRSTNNYNQFIDRGAFPCVEADHSALNGYMIAEEILEDLCLDGEENWQKFLQEFRYDYERAAGRLPKLPEVNEQMLLGQLQAQRERINHLLVHTHALGDPAQSDLLPGSVAEPSFFDKLQRLFERIQASGELAAREEAFRQDITAQEETLHQIEDEIRRGYEEAQRKILLDAIGRGKEEGDTAFADAAVLRQKQYQDAAGRQASRLHAQLVEIGDRFREWYEKQYRPSSPKGKDLSPIIKYKCDNINRAAVRAVSTPASWKTGLEGLAYGTEQSYKNLHITVGLPNTPSAKDLWGYLCQAGAVMVKAHYALWARWYEEDGIPGQYITVNISQFCGDLGYAKHPKGGYPRPQKQEAVKRLEALTSIEMVATFTPEGKNKPAQRLRGPLWQRGLIGEENDQYGDLFGSAREGTPDQWEPTAFSFAPGAWFSNPDWSRQNRFVGKISVGLLKLSVDTDKWAILIGGYLATLTRTNQYKPLVLRVDTILSRTDLAQGQDARRRAAVSQERFEKALDRLVIVSVIHSWEYVTGSESVEIEDPDNAQQIAEYYADDSAQKWRSKMVKIALPHEGDMKRLEEAQVRAIEQSKPRLGRPRKTSSA